MDFLSSKESSSPFFFSLFLIIFQNLTKYMICKNFSFDNRKDPPNKRGTTTGKKWGRTPLFKVKFWKVYF